MITIKKSNEKYCLSCNKVSDTVKAIKITSGDNINNSGLAIDLCDECRKKLAIECFTSLDSNV